MRNKFFALFVGFAFAINGIGTVLADTKAKKATTQTSQLAALLPASDSVVTFDVQQILSESVSQILSGKPQLLGEINARIDEIREKAGIDLRQFEQVAIGISFKEAADREIDIDPIVLARGKYNANALIALLKIALNGKYREEKSGSRTLYIFSDKEKIETDKTQTKKSVIDRTIDRLVKNLTKEFAVAAYDDNTLAAGSVARVRETFESKTRISSDVLYSVSRKPNAVMNFWAKLPNGLSKFINLDNDELGKTLDSIRQLAGALEVSGGNASVSISAKTLKAEQAQSLKDTIEDLQPLGKMIFGSSKNPDKKVYGRMIDNLKVARVANEVTLDLQVPQSDINILLGVK